MMSLFRLYTSAFFGLAFFRYWVSVGFWWWVAMYFFRTDPIYIRIIQILFALRNLFSFLVIENKKGRHWGWCLSQQDLIQESEFFVSCSKSWKIFLGGLRQSNNQLTAGPPQKEECGQEYNTIVGWSGCVSVFVSYYPNVCLWLRTAGEDRLIVGR